MNYPRLISNFTFDMPNDSCKADGRQQCHENQYAIELLQLRIKLKKFMKNRRLTKKMKGNYLTKINDTKNSKTDYKFTLYYMAVD